MSLHVIRPSKFRLVGLAVVLAASMGLAQAAAGATPVTRVFVVQVTSAQDHAFIVGWKAYGKCLHEHGFKHAAYVYDAETGDLSRYAFLDDYGSWGAMDAHDPADKPCAATFRTAVLPHVGEAFGEIAVLNAKESYVSGADPGPAPMMWLEAFRIKYGQDAPFNDVVAKVAAAAAKIHWGFHFAAYDVEDAGPGGEDFVLVSRDRSWADIGREVSPSVKDMMSSVYGEAAAEAMHQKFDATVAESWTEVWSYDKDLSLIPAK